MERLENPFRVRGAEPKAAAEAVPRLAPRPMTGYEEELVERHLHVANTSRLCNEVLAHCLVPPGADASAALARVRALSVARRDEALLELRRISLGDVVRTTAQCPGCGMALEVDFRISQLPLSIQTEAPASVDVMLDGGIPVSMRLPTAGDQEELLDTSLETEAQRRTWLLSRVLLRHGTEQGPFSEEVTRALPTQVRATLEQALEAALPELDLSMAVTCRDCGQAFNAPFDVSAFFLPR